MNVETGFMKGGIQMDWHLNPPTHNHSHDTVLSVVTLLSILLPAKSLVLGDDTLFPTKGYFIWASEQSIKLCLCSSRRLFLGCDVNLKNLIEQAAVPEALSTLAKQYSTGDESHVIRNNMHNSERSHFKAYQLQQQHPDTLLTEYQATFLYSIGYTDT